jgi:hypothetical protein
MANLANGYENHQDTIISHPHLLSSLHTCMSDAKADIRRPAVSCVLQLIRGNLTRRQEFQDAGIISTLKHLSNWGGGASVSPSVRTSSHHHVVEDDKQVMDLARQALDWLERSF